MRNNENDYQSYLLRIWRVAGSELTQYRITLEDVRSGKVFGYPNLDALFEHLRGLNDPETDGKEASTH